MKKTWSRALRSCSHGQDPECLRRHSAEDARPTNLDAPLQAVRGRPPAPRRPGTSRPSRASVGARASSPIHCCTRGGRSSLGSSCLRFFSQSADTSAPSSLEPHMSAITASSWPSPRRSCIARSASRVYAVVLASHRDRLRHAIVRRRRISAIPRGTIAPIACPVGITNCSTEVLVPMTSLKPCESSS